ncbi:MAG: flagellar biosynthesis protein FlhA [Planctomycetia bacterium]|nr:flagellar biosynthesis protein FlhA [Planctomycetia bacterium]
MDNTRNRLRIQDMLVPGALAASLFVILFTLPCPAMDLLLSLNIALSVVILFTTFFVSRPLEFSILPTILLGTTLFRLVLNVATTRLILTRAAEFGDEAAGGVIKSFSSFVTGESLVTGIVIFAIFIVIQFIVITKGATRISEVAARFTLDALPGRQMAIDADLAAGTITQEEASVRRAELAEQSDFFGAMDGACKFIRGDAIASIIITFVNILGGLFVGVVQHGMPITDALTVYTTLTIGDGLVTQIPALLISLGTGVLVSRSSQAKNLSRLVVTQIFQHPATLVLTGLFLALLSLTGMPFIPLLMLSVLCFGLAWVVTRQKSQEDKKSEEEAEAAAKESETANDTIEKYLNVDPMELEIGAALIPLADPQLGGDLQERVRAVRRKVAADMGIVLPKVRIRDSIALDESQYRIKINGDPVAGTILYRDMVYAVPTRLSTSPLAGLKTTDPATGQDAWWINPEDRDAAQTAGYLVLEPREVIERHLLESVLAHADELLTRDAANHLINELRMKSPAVVNELIPDLMKLSQVQQILQRLLRERVPIRQLGVILEAIGDSVGKISGEVALTEQVRRRLARTLSARYRDEDGILHVVLLDPHLEEIIRKALEPDEHEVIVNLKPGMTKELYESLRVELARIVAQGHEQVVLVSSAIRPAVRQITATAFPLLHVLSFNEVTQDTRVVSEGMASLPSD